MIRVGLDGRPLREGDRPSAETGLHSGVYRRFSETGAVLHGHSVPVTALSRLVGGNIRLEGYEVLKAFPGLATHAAAVELPVFDNDQDIGRLQDAVETRWAGEADMLPGYLLRGHGIYCCASGWRQTPRRRRSRRCRG